MVILLYSWGEKMASHWVKSRVCQLYQHTLFYVFISVVVVAEEM
jgi:hypothetical protein